jgi:hypothetical protein
MRSLEAASNGERRAPVLGALALLFLAVHGARHFRAGELENLLWLSNVATLLLAASSALGLVRGFGVALLWLSLSALLWVADVAGGTGTVDSAIFTHLGSFALALVAVRRFGFAPGSGYVAAGGLAALVGASRLVTDARHNVNLAFAVADGWGGRFPSHGVYLASLFVLASALFLALEHVLSSTLVRTPRKVG